MSPTENAEVGSMFTQQIDSTDMSLSKLQETVKHREAWHAAVHELTESRTQISNQTTTISKHRLPWENPKRSQSRFTQKG